MVTIISAIFVCCYLAQIPNDSDLQERHRLEEDTLVSGPKMLSWFG